jgi:hypothetical protein
MAETLPSMADEVDPQQLAEQLLALSGSRTRPWRLISGFRLRVRTR